MHACVYFCGIRFCSFSDIFQDMTTDSLGINYCPTMLLCDLQHVWVKPKCIFIQSKALAPRFRLTQMAPLSSTTGTAACFIAKLGSAIVYTTLMVHHYSSWYK